MCKASQRQWVLRALAASILVGWVSVPVAFASTPVQVSTTNDPGCPAQSRAGSYAPCMAELPKGALVSQGAAAPTPPVGLYHYLNSPQAGGVHTSAIPKAQSISMLPNPQTIWNQWKKVPLLAVTYSARLDGGIGQSNPTSAPLTAQFACPSVAQAGSSGIPGWSAGAPAKWSGWDLKWTSYDTSAANTPNKGWNGWDYTCQFTPQPTQACSVQYISGYDSQGNPIYSTYNYTAYGQWSWNDGNNGTWSAPSCNNPGPGNASPPPPKPSCGAGQTQTAAPTWNGTQWVGLQCSAPPQQQPTGSGSTQPTGGGQGNGNNNPPPPPPPPTCPAGQTQTAAPTWNGSAWVGLGCSASPSKNSPPPTQYTGDFCQIDTSVIFDGATTISQLMAVQPDGSGANNGNFWGNGGNGIVCHSQAWYGVSQISAFPQFSSSVAPGIYYDPVVPGSIVFQEMNTLDGSYDTGGTTIIFQPGLATASGFQQTLNTIQQQLAQQAAQVQALLNAEASSGW